MEKQTKNKYIKVAHFSEGKFRLILKCFCQDLTASQTAQFTQISRNTINRIFNLFRSRLAKFKGMKNEKFVLHLKECEFRFNARHDKLNLLLLREFRINPL